MSLWFCSGCIWCPWSYSWCSSRMWIQMLGREAVGAARDFFTCNMLQIHLLQAFHSNSTGSEHWSECAPSTEDKKRSDSTICTNGTTLFLICSQDNSFVSSSLWIWLSVCATNNTVSYVSMLYFKTNKFWNHGKSVFLWDSSCITVFALDFCLTNRHHNLGYFNFLHSSSSCYFHMKLLAWKITSQ